jgi:hypothetical protein
MFALQTYVLRHNTAELCMTIRPQRESTSITTACYSHLDTALDQTFQTAQTEGVFLKGEDNVLFSEDAFVRILLERSARLIVEGRRNTHELMKLGLTRATAG